MLLLVIILLNMKLSPSEELILRVITHRELYGSEIAKVLLECCGRQIREGSLYPALHRLYEKDLVSKRSETIKGVNRDYYKLTKLGTDTLDEIENGFEKLKNWENI